MAPHGRPVTGGATLSLGTKFVKCSPLSCSNVNGLQMAPHGTPVSGGAILSLGT